MKYFRYAISDPVGLQARPAEMLVEEASAMDSTITVLKGDGTSAWAGKLEDLLKLAIKHGETVTVTIEGENEESHAAKVEAFCNHYL